MRIWKTRNKTGAVSHEKKIVVTGGHLQVDNLQFTIFYDLVLKSQRIHVVNKQMERMWNEEATHVSEEMKSNLVVR